ncbi:YqjF family protein [Bacillus sp. z60-18]|uniref:YqjF family protein n=1 Tax=unclassified Bacillus (in: firmicutes) TaxID=185979 RepID=UPI00390C9ECB
MTITTTSHRPFPLPKGPWIMAQTWNDVLFAHWPVEPAAIRGKIPADLELETLNGKAWIGILPFLLTDLRARFLPPIPVISRFPEVNIRTYVTYQGVPGVYFFSLDAGSRLAALSARHYFHLPYFHADISFNKEDSRIRFFSRRSDSKAVFHTSYGPLSDPFSAQKGTLEYWLTERYRLYTAHNRRIYYEDIHHSQWTLQEAEAEFHQNTAAAASDLVLPHTAPLLHYAKKQHVLFWALQGV